MLWNERLAMMRKELGKSQEQVGREMALYLPQGETVSVGALSSWEVGRTQPKIHHALALARVLNNADVNYLFATGSLCGGLNDDGLLMLAEYRRGAECVKANPGLVPVLLGLSFLQLTALFAVPVMVYYAFGLTGSSAVSIICTQALVTLAVSNLPLPGAVGASEGGFVTAMALFFGPALVTPAVLVSRGISFYAFLLVSGVITLAVHLRSRRKRQVERSPRLPRPARGTVTT